MMEKAYIYIYILQQNKVNLACNIRGEGLSLDVGPELKSEKNSRKRGPPKGAKLFNCCHFPLERTHCDD